MIKVHERFSLDLKPGEIFHAKRVHEPCGQVPRVSLPQMSAGLLPRLRQGAWVMNAWTGTDSGCKIDFKAPEAHRFVEWTLAEGEAVCFDYRRLVGFSDGIRLKTVITLRLSAFSINRILFPVALGPGRLVVETVGVPDVYRSGVEGRAVSPARMVCWSADSVFALEVSTGGWDHYFSPVYLKPLETRGLVVDADDRGTHAGGFLRRLIKRVYSPW